MDKLVIPYIRSCKEATVISIDDIVLELFDDRVEVRRPSLGTKRTKKYSEYFIMKKMISGVDWAWCREAACYDFSIYSTVMEVGFNVSSEAEAKRSGVITF